MMDGEHLHLLIHEAIYLVPDRNVLASAKAPMPDALATEPVEKATAAGAEDPQDETPAIPRVGTEDKKEHVVPLAIFHEATDDSDIALLQKIIEACKLPAGQYQVFANGFNKEVKFKKAIVFVAQAKAFYEPIPYQASHILCSRPLSEMANNKHEKAKLWGALQLFI